uniref:Uncharacterized protein n=1 Tax=Glossina austeni TaxID=7395 RepID=A0A1A9VP45_GLOAU
MLQLNFSVSLLHSLQTVSNNALESLKKYSLLEVANNTIKNRPDILISGLQAFLHKTVNIIIIIKVETMHLIIFTHMFNSNILNGAMVKNWFSSLSLKLYDVVGGSIQTGIHRNDHQTPLSLKNLVPMLQITAKFEDFKLLQPIDACDVFW